MKLLYKERCVGCKQERFTAKKRKIRTPLGMTATSKEPICAGCYKSIKKEFSTDAPK